MTAPATGEGLAAVSMTQTTATAELVAERLNNFTTCGCSDHDWPQLRQDTVGLLDALTDRLATIREDTLREAAGIAAHYNFGPERTERDNARNATAQIIATAILARIEQPKALDGREG